MGEQHAGAAYFLQCHRLLHSSEFQPLWLLGESNDRNCVASNIQNSAVVQGNHAKTLIVRNGKDCETLLSEQEGELLRIYQSLSVKGQTKLLPYAFSLEAEEGE
jgi:hypothetical protein